MLYPLSYEGAVIHTTYQRPSAYRRDRRDTVGTGQRPPIQHTARSSGVARARGGSRREARGLRARWRPVASEGPGASQECTAP